jgi:deoxycytidine triphosphate deaminase
MIDPLDRKYANSSRILSDRGIMQAMDFGFIKTSPVFDPETDTKRIQPATLDVKIASVDEKEPLVYERAFRYGSIEGEKQTLKGRCVSTINLTEVVDFGQVGFSSLHRPFLGISVEARSSVRRLGGYIPEQGRYLFSVPEHYTQIEMGNFSRNDIHFKEGDRIAQVFFPVFPFKDYVYGVAEDTPEIKEIGEQIRSLDMGMDVSYTGQFEWLVKNGHLEVTPSLELKIGTLLVHASKTVYRMKMIDSGIDFDKRDDYKEEDVLEPIDISKGYTVQTFEHIIIETRESFNLSPHVGIRFWDQPICSEFMNLPGYMTDFVDRMKNIHFSQLTDGWVDPNYQGGFSRQPKWLTGRTIYPGDVIGYGQVFFFPNGVGRAYGDSSLGSQYLSADETRFSKK